MIGWLLGRLITLVTDGVTVLIKEAMRLIHVTEPVAPGTTFTLLTVIVVITALKPHLQRQPAGY